MSIVTIGMSHQPTVMRYVDATQGDEVAIAKAMNVVAVANTHVKSPVSRWRRFYRLDMTGNRLQTQRRRMMTKVVIDKAGDIRQED